MDKELFVCNDYSLRHLSAALAEYCVRHLQLPSHEPMIGRFSSDKLFSANALTTRHNVASRSVARVHRC